MQETWVPSLVWEDPLEKEMASHSSTLTWKIPLTGEPGGLQAMAKSWTWLNRSNPSKNQCWDLSSGPVVNSPSNAGSLSSIPDWGAKTPHASGLKDQMIKQKQYCNKFNKDFKNCPCQKKKKISAESLISELILPVQPGNTPKWGWELCSLSSPWLPSD